jgi:hypothetical protein
MKDKLSDNFFTSSTSEVSWSIIADSIDIINSNSLHLVRAVLFCTYEKFVLVSRVNNMDVGMQ